MREPYELSVTTTENHRDFIRPRKWVALFNAGDEAIYINFDQPTVSGKRMKLDKGQTLILEDETLIQRVYYVTAIGTATLYVLASDDQINQFTSPIASVEVIPESSLTLVDSSIANINTGSYYETSAFVDVEKFVSIVVSLDSDQNLTFLAEFSNDGINIDAVHQEDFTANGQEGYEIPVVGSYFKMKISNNSGTNTTHMRCYAKGKTQ